MNGNNGTHTNHYIVPPKLQSKLLLLWWTIPELLIAAGLLIAVLFNNNFLVATALFLFLTARFDREHCIKDKLFIRIRFYATTKTYRMMLQ